MKPNFNQSSRPYRIETDSLGKGAVSDKAVKCFFYLHRINFDWIITNHNIFNVEVYQYTIKNESSEMTHLERKREEKMYKEVSDNHVFIGL